MSTARYWHRIDHMDPRALDMADRHYSRQSPGTPEFIPNGNKIVLMHFVDDGTPEGSPAALWSSHRPDPGSGAVRSDGLDVWACTLFRIEQRTVLASDLIREAVAITRWLWSPLPRDGFYTTINPRKVPPIMRRGRPFWGYSYVMAGWVVDEARTKRRDLIRLFLPPDQLAQVEPVTTDTVAPPFGTAWRRWPKTADENQMVLL